MFHYLFTFVMCLDWSGFIHFIDADDEDMNCFGFIGSIMSPGYADTCIFVLFTSRTTIEGLGLYCVILDFVVVLCGLMPSFLSTKYYRWYTVTVTIKILQNCYPCNYYGITKL